MTRAWFGIGSVFLLLVLMTPRLMWGQGNDDVMTPGGDGPVGNAEGDDRSTPDLEDVTPGWEDLSGYQGPLGRVDEYLPHDACESCFTLPNYDEYSVYEYALSDVEDGAIILTRDIPNPAPEVTEMEGYDPTFGGYIDPDTNERVWFIGTQEIVGPTDEEKWSPDLPVSTIEMKRIQARYLDTLLSIPGVSIFGIGPKGFVVYLLSHHADESRARIPLTLDGVRVDVELTTEEAAFVRGSHDRARIRPVPAGGLDHSRGEHGAWDARAPRGARYGHGQQQGLLSDVVDDGRACRESLGHLDHPLAQQAGLQPAHAVRHAAECHRPHRGRGLCVPAKILRQPAGKPGAAHRGSRPLDLSQSVLQALPHEGQPDL